MTGNQPAEILRLLEAPCATDRELIERFALTRDQSAFAELVRKYGPVVLGVCKRVTGHEQDAEDAFQAVFLILARKATAIGKPDLLGNWLYGVAVRVAKTLRRSVDRRRAHEVVPTVLVEPMTRPDSSICELSSFLDEELAALPSWYREAIVLCDLQGIAREEAAARLGVPEGTLSSRLANGRKKLAERLTKQGITFSAAAIPATLSQAQAVNVSTELIAKACSLVADWGAGGKIPKPFAKLSGGGTTMWKVGSIVLLIATLAVVGVVSAFHTPENPPPDKREPVLAVKPVAAEQAVPSDKPDEKQLVFTSAPKLRDVLDLKGHQGSNVGLHWNAQGDRIAIVAQDTIIDPRVVAKKGEQPELLPYPMLYVVTISSLRTAKITNVTYIPLVDIDKQWYQAFVGFTPDGKQVLTEHREYSLFSGVHKLKFWDPSGGAVGQPVPKDDAVEIKEGNKFPRMKEVKSVDLLPTETKGYYPSPDGKTYRTLGIERDPKTETVTRLSVMEVDAATGERVKTLLTTQEGLFSKTMIGKREQTFEPDPSSVEAAIFAMSPDWKRLAVLGNEETVVMFDVDRATKVFSFKVPSIDVKKNAVPTREVTSLERAWYRSENEFYRPFVSFSPDGHRLLVSCGPSAYQIYKCADGSEVTQITSDGLGQCLVLDTDNGERVPVLEGAESLLCIPETDVFSANGRLLALSGLRCGISRQKIVMVSGNRTSEPGKNPNLTGEQIVIDDKKVFMTVWDTQTGKNVKGWEGIRELQVAFNPVRSLLAAVEPTRGSPHIRFGLWDFSAEMAEKK